MNCKEVEQLQAANVILSYLKHAGVDASLDNCAVRVNDISVRFGKGYDTDSLQVDIADLRSNKVERLSRAVNTFCEYAKIASVPVVMRSINRKRSNLDSGFDAIVFREKTFANSPNPPPELLNKWKHIPKQHARTAFARYRTHLSAFGYESGDLESIALVHLCTFLHKYMTGDDLTDHRNMHRFMKQRMTEVVFKIKRKAIACIADSSQKFESETVI